MKFVVKKTWDKGEPGSMPDLGCAKERVDMHRFLCVDHVRGSSSRRDDLIEDGGRLFRKADGIEVWTIEISSSEELIAFAKKTNNSIIVCPDADDEDNRYFDASGARMPVIEIYNGYRE